MRKQIFGILSLFVLLPFAQRVYAAGLTIRLEQPKTPTNQNTFTIVFTALDIQGQPITVKCFKQGPSDGAPVQFGSDITLAGGGNTGSCQVTSNQINDNGTYTFSVTATDGTNTATDTTTMVYNTNGPGDPKDYNKTKVGNCSYTIHFKTADDGGKTVKTEIYRSENTSFNADSGTQVGTINGGSDEAHDFPNDVPNCDKTYYYAIRSFDSAGNGSNTVGDTVNITHLTTISPTPGANQGAIPVAAGEGNVLGMENGVANGATEAPTPTGGALGEATPAAEVVNMAPQPTLAQWILTHKKISLIAAVAVGAILLYARRKK